MNETNDGKTAYFDPRGYDFWEDRKYISDVGNYRILTCVKAKTGEPLIIEFGGYQKFDYTKKKRKLIRENALRVNGSYCEYRDKPDSLIGCDFGTYMFDFEERLKIQEDNYDYMRADILRFLSDVTGENYTQFEMNRDAVDEIIKTIYAPVEKEFQDRYIKARDEYYAKRNASSKAFREEWQKKIGK